MRQHLRTHLAASVRSMFTLPNTSRYQVLRRAAVEAARRNNAALWFVEPDRSNVFVNSDGSGGNPAPGAVVGLLLPPDPVPATELFSGGDASVLGTWANSNGSVTLESGEFRLDTTAAFGGSSRIINTVPGRLYKCTATYRSGLGGPCRVILRTEGPDTITNQVQLPDHSNATPQTHTRYIRATTNQLWVRLTSMVNAGGDVAYFDNISVQEVPYYLWRDATSTKPIITQPGVTDPNRVGLRFDGVDDYLGTPVSPINIAPGSSYTLIMAGQAGAAVAAGARMGISDGRGLGLNGNGATQQAETLHGGAARYGFPTTWPASARRVVSATFNGATQSLIQRQSGSQVFSGVVAPTSEATQQMFMGVRWRLANGFQEYWSGDIFLACAASGVMPLEDIQAIERFAGLIGGATVA